ncbi:glycosyltransferase family 9 protein, partial [bacterium]|nr:glycosyltransferase family 9 protein [bacterium]
IPLRASEITAANELLAAEEVDTGDFIVGINVNASDVAIERRWPLENFAALADLLSQRLGANVILVGAPDEVPYVERAIAMMRETPVNLSGRTTLREVIALMDRMHLFITNDSGPLHLAYAMGTPTISLFGPETPLRYGPIGKKHSAVYKQIDCSPCLNFGNLKRSNCQQEGRCMKEIKVHEIFELVERGRQQWKEKGEITDLASPVIQ